MNKETVYEQIIYQTVKYVVESFTNPDDVTMVEVEELLTKELGLYPSQIDEIAQIIDDVIYDLKPLELYKLDNQDDEL